MLFSLRFFMIKYFPSMLSLGFRKQNKFCNQSQRPENALTSSSKQSPTPSHSPNNLNCPTGTTLEKKHDFYWAKWNTFHWLGIFYIRIGWWELLFLFALWKFPHHTKHKAKMPRKTSVGTQILCIAGYCILSRGKQIDLTVNSQTFRGSFQNKELDSNCLSKLEDSCF